MGVGVARALARQGAHVAVNDLFPERAQAAVAQLAGEGLQVLTAPGDVTDAAVREGLVAQVQRELGEIDILVNNAGVPPGMPTSLRQFKDLADEDFERQLDLNLRAILGLTRLVVDGMCERRFGRIVIISSESWRVGLNYGLSNYAAAKAAQALVTFPIYSKASSAMLLADVSVAPHAVQTYAMISKFRSTKRFMARMPKLPSTWRRRAAPVKGQAQRRVRASAVATCARVTARCARSKGSSLSNGHVQPVMDGARLSKTHAAPVRAKVVRMSARPYP
jgi:NAD(P)-dependent dehydrogenase (short-subunit alcohol dehydrogenase family)